MKFSGWSSATDSARCGGLRITRTCAACPKAKCPACYGGANSLKEQDSSEPADFPAGRTFNGGTCCKASCRVCFPGCVFCASLMKAKMIWIAASGERYATGVHRATNLSSSETTTELTASRSNTASSSYAVRAGGKTLLVRIVCQELEAWYVGDPDAMAAAFGDQSLKNIGSRAKYRDPDALP